MPRLVQAVPKYRKHRASGQAVVTLSGKDHYLGPYGSKASKVAYDRLTAQWLENGREIAQPQDEITVTELAIRYVKHAQAYYVKDGRCTKETPAIKRALQYLRAWHGDEPAVDFGPLRLRALRKKMVDDGLSRTYVNSLVGKLKRAYRWAAAEELIPADAYRALDLVEGLRRGRTEARETKPVLPVDDASVDATLPHLPAVVADMVRLQRITGMRPAEVCILRPCDLDRSGDVWTYTPASHKTEHHGRARAVYIGPKGQGVLLRYLARGESDYCFRPCDSEAKRRAAQHEARKTPLSCGNKPGSNRSRRPKRPAGDCYTTASYGRAITRACEKAGVEKWSPNRLRHTAATEIRREFGLEASQIILGHSNAAVTQVYAERDAAKGFEVARQIG